MVINKFLYGNHKLAKSQFACASCTAKDYGYTEGVPSAAGWRADGRVSTT
jgi:hypothetical protein